MKGGRELGLGAENTKDALVSANVVFASTLILQYLMLGSFGGIFAGIIHMGQYFHPLMINLPMQPESNTIVAFFLELVKFDFVPTDKFLDEKMFGELEETPANFQVIGYETGVLFQLMGSAFYLLLAQPLHYVLLKLLNKCTQGEDNGCIRQYCFRFSENKLNSYTKESAIQFFEAQYLPLHVMSTLNALRVYKEGGPNV